MNVPNVLTLFRVLFAIAVFYFCAVANWDLCLLFFVLASLTDFVDGWWARKFKQVTVFGRIMDPFADKFLICGTFICLLGVPFSGMVPPFFADVVGVKSAFRTWYMLQPWMVIVIVARELLITSIRAFVEKSGGDFSAKWIGKWKMGVQCLAVIACFLYLGSVYNFPRGDSSWLASTLCSIASDSIWYPIVFWTMLASLWATVLITLYSGVTYCWRAAKMIGKEMDT